MCDLHLARLSFRLYISWRDQVRLEVPAPLHGALDPLFAVVHLPLAGAAVPGVTSGVIEESLFPWIIRVGLRQLDGFGVLDEGQLPDLCHQADESNKPL